MLKLMKTGLATAMFAAVAGTALPVHAGVMSATDKTSLSLASLTDQVHWRRYHHRHWVGSRPGWRYGWHRGWDPYRSYGYNYGYPYYGRYGAYGFASGLAAGMTGPSVAEDGNYCATPAKTCLLYEPGWLGTGCSCKVPDGRARGAVVE